MNRREFSVVEILPRKSERSRMPMSIQATQSRLPFSSYTGDAHEKPGMLSVAKMYTFVQTVFLYFMAFLYQPRVRGS